MSLGTLEGEEEEEEEEWSRTISECGREFCLSLGRKEGRKEGRRVARHSRLGPGSVEKSVRLETVLKIVRPLQARSITIITEWICIKACYCHVTRNFEGEMIRFRVGEKRRE